MTSASERRIAFPSLRLRITAGALVVSFASLAVAGLLVVRSAESSVRAQIDRTVRANADFVVRTLRAGGSLPVREGPTDLYVQFLGANGRVVGASSAAAALPPLAKPARSGSEPATVVTLHAARLGDLRAIVESAPVLPQTTLVVARSTESVRAVHDSLVPLIEAMVLLGALLLGLLVWIVVGRALRPVEAMRRSAEAISDRALDQRVAVPRGRDEISRLAVTLNELLARVELSFQRERRFVADASHELRTPIAAMRALLEIDAPTAELEEVGTRAEVLERLAQLQDLVEELLVLGRAEAPLRDVRLVDLDELVLRQAARVACNTKFEVNTTGISGGQILGRDTDLARLIENLATNAARHARSRIGFSVMQIGDVVELTVTDDGAGIPSADRVRVFERFATLDDSRAGTQKGAGLGLAIVAAIVAAHRGAVSVDDAPGGGARVRVCFPASVAAAEP